MKKIDIVSSTRFEGSDVEHAACIKAGDWVFLNGIEATDYRRGAEASVQGHPGLPYHGLPKHRREGDFVVARIQQLLEAAGTNFYHSVRLDQYYSTWKAVDPYHLSRTQVFGKHIPPSTSVVMAGLSGPGLEIDTSLVAVLPNTGRDPQRLSPPDVTAPTWSGFAPAVRSGDFVFIAGIMARAADHSSPAHAHVPANSKWGGYEIRRQAEYIINEKIKPSLQVGGSSPANVVKAQVYLRHLDDLPHFLDVWDAHFGARQVALTIVTASDFGLVDGDLEINVVAVADGAKTKKQVIDTGLPAPMCFGAPAVRAGDLLLFSGMQAVDENGPIPAIAEAAGLPYLGIAGYAQMEYILDHVQAICAHAGTSLENLTRVQLFQTDPQDFQGIHRAWQKRCPGRPLPFALVQTPAHQAVPGCTLVADMWVYAPV
ncbi:MAG TPA: RidA family protein [Bordetella sp.]|nr:RidA family protein [Bordetella sp.]